jgi:hypothetical protein
VLGCWQRRCACGCGHSDRFSVFPASLVAPTAENGLYVTGSSYLLSWPPRTAHFIEELEGQLMIIVWCVTSRRRTRGHGRGLSLSANQLSCSGPRKHRSGMTRKWAGNDGLLTHADAQVVLARQLFASAQSQVSLSSVCTPPVVIQCTQDDESDAGDRESSKPVFYFSNSTLCLEARGHYGWVCLVSGAGYGGPKAYPYDCIMGWWIDPIRQ